MKYPGNGWVVVAALLAGTTAGGSAPCRPRPARLDLQDPAPDFALQDAEGKATVRLAELRGKPAVLLFGSCT
jgi:cytochrome oxidase Cu insertion factor (SCO1/SenC/PrrC family)